MPHQSSILPRQTFLQVLRAALLAGEQRFAHQAALKWLAYYPGDLQVGLCYGQALSAEGRYRQALHVLQGLCRADPEFVDAVQAAMQVQVAWQAALSAQPEADGGKKDADFQLPWETTPPAPDPGLWRSYLFALTGQASGAGPLATWSEPVWQARLALSRGDLMHTEFSIRQALAGSLTPDSDPPVLVYLTHLHFLAANPRISLAGRQGLAESYARRWPDCLPVMLYLAEWSMAGGDSDRAVALLHQAAVRDVSGQAARRLWGADHPYRALWPENLELALDLPLPARVSAALGWNRLSAPLTGNPPSNPNPPISEPLPPVLQQPPAPPDVLPSPAPPAQEVPMPVAPPLPAASPKNISPADPELSLVAEELERLAARARRPGLTRQDDLYPVYVIFSLRHRLRAVYGEKAALALEQEMQDLARAVKTWRSWGSLVFLPDDPDGMAKWGLKAVRSAGKSAPAGDPWELKHALTDLDARLAKQGARIGALLIVGGPEIVPYHLLPNPVDDQDAVVPSDNPYATRDANYFLPEWPVGRLPGGLGGDPRFLLGMLQKFQTGHRAACKNTAWPLNWFRALRAWWQKWRSPQASFGYTAQLWSEIAGQVFRPIGRADHLHVTPPLGIHDPLQKLFENGAALPTSLPDPGSRPSPDGSLPELAGRLAYFNLHGMQESLDWYGHRDPLKVPESDEVVDYPVALRPQDVKRRKGRLFPLIVFSEACYGLYVEGRCLENSIALQFLSSGSLALAGSTCMSYGSIGGPLMGADFLGQAFWSSIQRGAPAGEALRQAKARLVDEMQRRQGYLDGEDQKTLISFILFGDPLAVPACSSQAPKSIRYRAPARAQVKTVCDRAGAGGEDAQVPAEVMVSVRKALKRYLPGMLDAQIVYTRERERCAGDGHACPTSQLLDSTHHKTPPGSSGAARAAAPADRSLVTLSKRIATDAGVHLEIARLTIDSQGKLVKLVVSR